MPLSYSDDPESKWLAGRRDESNQLLPGKLPVVSNVDALPSTDPDEIRGKLERQIVSPVLWVDSVNYMISQGVTRFVEFGPQKVLSGMIKNIDKEIQCVSWIKWKNSMQLWTL